MANERMLSSTRIEITNALGALRYALEVADEGGECSHVVNHLVTSILSLEKLLEDDNYNAAQEHAKHMAAARGEK